MRVVWHLVAAVACMIGAVFCASMGPRWALGYIQWTAPGVQDPERAKLTLLLVAGILTGHCCGHLFAAKDWARWYDERRAWRVGRARKSG